MIQTIILMSNNEKNNHSNKPIIESANDGFISPRQPQKIRNTAGKIHQLNAQAGNLPEATTPDYDMVNSSLHNINKLVNEHLKTLLTNSSTSTNLDSILSYLMENNNMRSYSLNDEDTGKAYGKDQEKNKYLEQRHISPILLGKKIKRNDVADSQFNFLVPNEIECVNKKTIKVPDQGANISDNNVQEIVNSLLQKLATQQKHMNGSCAQSFGKNTDINDKNENFNCIIDNYEKLPSSKVNLTDCPKPYEEENLELEYCEMGKRNIIVNLQTNVFNIMKVQRKVNSSANNDRQESQSSHNISVFIF
jgi:hypothetical protein